MACGFNDQFDSENIVLKFISLTCFHLFSSQGLNVVKNSNRLKTQNLRSLATSRDDKIKKKCGTATPWK